MANYVLVHGAWHSGKELQDVADLISAKGHVVHTPTILGNGKNDSKRVGITEAIQSIVDFLISEDIADIVLLGHSYGGMIITGVADAIPDIIRRLVYWNAFVPNDGEAVADMAPSAFMDLMYKDAEERGDGSAMIPFTVWRELLMNDADYEMAERAYQLLNPHPLRTFTDKIRLKTNPVDMEIPKSYINCTSDTALPHDMPWHPRISRKLGLFRLIQLPGGHELSFTNPDGLAQAILAAGRD